MFIDSTNYETRIMSSNEVFSANDRFFFRLKTAGTTALDETSSMCVHFIYFKGHRPRRDQKGP
jgi:hypothetical protein